MNAVLVRRIETKEEAKELERKCFLSGNSLFVQGTNDFSMPDDLRKARTDYFAGKLKFSEYIKMLKKYYGYGRILSITPAEDELRAAAQAPLAVNFKNTLILLFS